MATSDSHTPGVGDLVSRRYRIDSVIGTGGMAVVYRAVDEELGRHVALKVFRANVVDAASVSRQAEEIRLIASLDHPALVTLYDAVPGIDGDEHATGVLVMQLVEGRDLRHRIAADGPLAGQAVAEIGADVAGALAYVHGRGVIHRDVSPANVLLPDAREPGSPVARLADFGIARLIDSAGLTQTGTVIGTATYLSPEQAEGKPLGPTTDIYSLGLTLLEALTGDRAFPGSAIESATARLSSDPLIPASLGASWGTLLTAMTSRDPAARPTAAEVAAELRVLEAAVDTGSATALLPVAEAAATEVLGASEALAATKVLAASEVLAATEVLHRETHVSTPPVPKPAASSERRRALLIVVALAAAAAIVAAVFLVNGLGGPAEEVPVTPDQAAASPTPEAEVVEEPVAPVEPEYPAVDGEIGEALARLQQLVAYGELDEQLATALQQQVLAVSTSAADGDLEAASEQLKELRTMVDEARESGALDEGSAREIREAGDAVERSIKDASKGDKPGNGPGPKGDD